MTHFMSSTRTNLPQLTLLLLGLCGHKALLQDSENAVHQSMSHPWMASWWLVVPCGAQGAGSMVLLCRGARPQ